MTSQRSTPSRPSSTKRPSDPDPGRAPQLLRTTAHLSAVPPYAGAGRETIPRPFPPGVRAAPTARPADTPPLLEPQLRERWYPVAHDGARPCGVGLRER